jgi:hypothetical protein
MNKLLIVVSLIFCLSSQVQALDVSNYHPEPFKGMLEEPRDTNLPSAGTILGVGKIFDRFIKYNDFGEFVSGKFMVIFKGKYYVCSANYSETSCDLVDSLPTTDKRNQ